MSIGENVSELAKLFDRYSLNARVKPAFLLFLPVVVMVYVLFEPSRTLGGSILTLLLSFGVVAFAANQMSTHGNLLQEKLFAKWGGAPSTIILRHSDSRLDRNTKQRYKLALEGLIPNFKAPTEAEEKADPRAADEMYDSAASYLREHTRDAKKFALILNENIEYGFSRNLLACKPMGLFLSIACLALSLALFWKQFHKVPTQDMVAAWDAIPVAYFVLVIAQTFVTIAWFLLVSEKWVQVRAFAYTKRLYAACEKIK